MHGFSNASFADAKGALTTSGYIIKLFEDLVAWKSTWLRCVSLSTCQTEYVAMSEACQEMVLLHNSIRLSFE